jgi:hypothetical protein
MVACAACGGASTPATAPARATAPAVLTITELKFYLGDDVGITVDADGTIRGKTTSSQNGKSTESWNVVAKLASDGSVTHEGRLLGRLKPDGVFEGPGAPPATFRIDGTTLVFGDRRFSIDDKGMFEGPRPAGSPHLRIQGLTDDGSRRAALLVVALLFPVAQP